MFSRKLSILKQINLKKITANSCKNLKSWKKKCAKKKFLILLSSKSVFNRTVMEII